MQATTFTNKRGCFMKNLFLLAFWLTGAVYAAPTETEVVIKSWQAYIRYGVDYNFEVRIDDASPAAALTACSGQKVFTLSLPYNTYVGMYAVWQAVLQYTAATDPNSGVARNKVFIKYDPAICDATRGAVLLGIRNFPQPE